ncbi:MAG: U4/U6 small nuclear ribonucleoprotein prp4 [Claussenomyces sp. TS43310]|nr:MAG: U4/U6 small nuclear ribonucleoprotein prp4 [Claussenomyces sp. TS43310]
MSSAVSSDEGEISESGIEKATTSLAQFDGTSVDPPDRTRSRYSSSKSPSVDNTSSWDRRSRDRSRSPYSSRTTRGSKRSRVDDHHERDHADPRRFRVQYEGRLNDHRRSRLTYEDLDRDQGSSQDLRYDDRDRYADKRHRTRSRSPYRARRDRSTRDPPNHSQRDVARYAPSSADRSRYGYEAHGAHHMKDQSVSKRGENPMPTDPSRREAKDTQGYSQQRSSRIASEHGLEKLVADLSSLPTASSDISDVVVEENPLDEAALIELRRKKREAIKAKYRGAATPMMVQALLLNTSATPTPGRHGDETSSTRSGKSIAPLTGISPVLSTLEAPKDAEDAPSPGVFAITSDQDLANTNGDGSAIAEDDGPSAADYDPTMDMREDKRRDDQRHNDEMSSTTYDEIKPSVERIVLLPESAAPVSALPKSSKEEFDMFASDDEDDMFADIPAEKANGSRDSGKLAEPSVAVPLPKARELDIGMLDNWDDPEGYYKIILGELLNGRYHVQSNLGQGMFSGVVRAMDVTTKNLVAIKLIRNNETMRKAGMKEIQILQQLKEADPEDKKHLIRLERHFEHKGHLCMVFENLSINLREVLKKFGRDVGINLKAVRAYAQQMFLGLSLMRKCSILHADLKPDNILVNEARNMLKICDLGSASDASDNEITPYLVSRFYRAPEIILGMPYDFAIDIWSVGCTLYELYTGKILFTGRTNNQMLRSIMECRGKFTVKMLRRAQFAHVHFDEMANFKSVEQDRLSGKDTVKTMSIAKPVRDLRTRLVGASKGLDEEEMKDLNLFMDLLDRCLALNPERRCTPAEALKHPFISRLAR